MRYCITHHHLHPPSFLPPLDHRCKPLLYGLKSSRLFILLFANSSFTRTLHFSHTSPCLLLPPFSTSIILSCIPFFVGSSLILTLHSSHTSPCLLLPHFSPSIILSSPFLTKSPLQTPPRHISLAATDK